MSIPEFDELSNCIKEFNEHFKSNPGADVIVSGLRLKRVGSRGWYVHYICDDLSVKELMDCTIEVKIKALPLLPALKAKVEERVGAQRQNARDAVRKYKEALCPKS